MLFRNCIKTLLFLKYSYSHVSNTPHFVTKTTSRDKKSTLLKVAIQIEEKRISIFIV